MSVNQLEGTLAAWIWIQLSQHGHSLLVAYSRQNDCRLPFFLLYDVLNKCYYISTFFKEIARLRNKIWLFKVTFSLWRIPLPGYYLAEFILETSYPSRPIIRQTDNSSKYKSEDEFWRIVCLDILRGKQETLRKYGNQSTVIYLETSSKNRLLSV